MAAISGGNVLSDNADLSFGPFVNAGAPTNGTSGTFAGVAKKGALLIDATTPKLYQNTNTLASPTWTSVGSQT